MNDNRIKDAKISVVFQERLQKKMLQKFSERAKIIDAYNAVAMMSMLKKLTQEENEALHRIINNGYSYNAARFFGMSSSGVDPQNVANTAFAHYLEETYPPKERGKHNMTTECTKFPAWLFAKIGGSK